MTKYFLCVVLGLSVSATAMDVTIKTAEPELRITNKSGQEIAVRYVTSEKETIIQIEDKKDAIIPSVGSIISLQVAPAVVIYGEPVTGWKGISDQIDRLQKEIAKDPNKNVRMTVRLQKNLALL